MRRDPTRHSLLAASAASAALLASSMGVALADGAFPDSQNVLLPADRPQQIILAANFGLVISDDDGAHWQYACESQATANGRLYSSGPPPGHRIFAVSDFGAPVSDDGGCTWRLGVGAFEGGLVYDVFPDPVDAAHVLVVAKPPTLGAAASTSVFESLDGGMTYERTLHAGPTAGGVTGVEIARADPRTIYITIFETSALDALPHPRLLRSADGGTTFETVDLEPMLGASTVSLAAVDLNDARKIFLRVTGTNEQMRSMQQIALSTDGGSTFTKPLTLTGGTLTAFLARGNGTVLVSGLLGATVVAYRSRDGGTSFESWRSGLHPRGFAERGTTLFVAADDVADGFALASSEDDGDTWTPRLHFAQIEGIRACVQQACLEDCGRQTAIGLFERAACGPAPTGSGGAAGGQGGGGSGCSSAGDAGSAAPGAALALALLLRALAGARKRTKRTPRGDG